MDFTSIFTTLQNYGIIDLFIPFLLIFSIVYAILLKIKIFGDPKDKKYEKIYIIIAFSFGIFSIVPHFVPMEGVPDIVNIMKGSFPQVSFLLLVILSVAIVLGILGARLDLMETGAGAGIMIFLSAVIVAVFLKAANVLNETTPLIGPLLFGHGNQDIWNLVVALAVFGIIIWFIVKEDKKPGEDTAFDKMKNLFKRV